MKLGDLRRWCREELGGLTRLGPLDVISADTLAIEVDVLICAALRIETTELFSHPEKLVSSEEFQRIKSYVARREQQEPIAYITGEKEFYSLLFKVRPGVLIPRPETELLVERVVVELERSQDDVVLVDVGTGSGAIIVAVLSELRNRMFSSSFQRIQAIGCDISEDALAVALENATRHSLESKITFVHSNLLESVTIPTDKDFVCVSNPPYIADSELLPRDVELYEPIGALRAGEAGLDVICALIEQCSEIPAKNKSIFIEIGHDQKDAIESLFEQAGYRDIVCSNDFSGLDRVIEGKV